MKGCGDAESNTHLSGLLGLLGCSSYPPSSSLVVTLPLARLADWRGGASRTLATAMTEPRTARHRDTDRRQHHEPDP